MRRLVLLFSLLMVALGCAPLSAQAARPPSAKGSGTQGPGPIKAPHVTVEMVSAGPEIAAGGAQTLAFVFSMEDGWHVYWKNAGFAGFPPKATWTLPKGFTAGDLEFPAPERLPLDTAADYGYEDSAVYPAVLTAGKNARPGEATIAAHLSWLVCKQVCVPGRADLALKLRVVAAGKEVSHEGEKAGALAAALRHLPQPLPDDFRIQANGAGDRIVLIAHTGDREKDAEFFPSDPDTVADTAKLDAKPLADGVEFDLQKSPNAATMPKELRGLLKLDDENSYDFSVPIKPGLPAAAAPSETGSAARLTVFSAIGLALLGGMLLNLMPCVFPVLFLKALALVQSSSEERGRQRTHGLVYTAGIVASFWGVVAVLLMLRDAGRQFGWGFQLQSPGFVAVLTVLLFLFALSLAGMFELGLSLTSAGDSLTRRHGYAGSFFTGVLATVVATPCVGPFMGAAIGFALAQPPFVTLVVFTALAIGLALPYLLLTLQPAWVRVLPRPGAWMEILKQLSSVPLFAFVIWLVVVYGELHTGPAGEASGIAHMAMLMAALLVVVIAAWALGRWPARKGSTIAAAALIVAAISIPLVGDRPAKNPFVWQPYSAEAIDQARAQGKAVFVDFTAAWCLSCKVNERVVLDSPEVQAQLRKTNVVAMRADWTQYDPKITAALQEVGRSGVPTYIVYPANASAAPDVLPELLSKGVVLGALQRDLK